MPHQSPVPLDVALLDTVTSAGGRKVWQQFSFTPHKGNRGGRLSLAGQTATFVPSSRTKTPPDKELALGATWATPAEVKLSPTWRDGGIQTQGSTQHLVVITVQDGPPPPVRFHGDGPGAAITVGRRTIRLPGNRIALPTPAGRRSCD